MSFLINQNKKLSRVWLFSMFFIGVLAVIPTLLLQTLHEVYRDHWLEEKIPYPVEALHINFLMRSHLSRVLREGGLDRENFIISWIDNGREKDYQEILAIIPKDEALRVRYWDEHVIVPYIQDHGNNIADKKLIEESYRNLIFLINNETQSSYFDEYGKYVTLSRISRLVIAEDEGRKPLNAEKQRNILSSVRKTLAVLHQAKYEAFLSNAKDSVKSSLPKMANNVLWAALHHDFLEGKCAILKEAIPVSERLILAYENYHFQHQEVSLLKEQISLVKVKLNNLRMAGQCNE